MSAFNHSKLLADIAPGVGYTRKFDYCLRITNLEKYPDYLLFIQVGRVIPSRAVSPYILIQSSECIPLLSYRPVATIAAIAKDKTKPNDLANVHTGESHQLPNGMRWRVDQDFMFLQNTNLQQSLIKGTPVIKPPSDLPFIYEGKQIEDSFQIQSLDANGLQLSLVSRSPQMVNWIIFPLIGFAILGWLIWRRRKQTSNQP